jgi:thiol-disulfide isomerase/thioredoxin
MIRKLILLAVACILLVTAAGCGDTDSDKKEQAKQTSQTAQETTAKNVTLKTFDGSKQIQLSDLYKDKPVFLNFWASWCPPCVKEMPHIEKLYNKYGDKVNFAVVNVDSKEADANAFLQKNSFSMPIYKGDLNSLTDAYRLNAIPVSVVIDKNGKIIAQHVGGMSEQEMEKLLAPVL